MGKDKKQYIKYLKKMNQYCNFYDPAKKMLSNWDNKMHGSKNYTIFKTTVTATLPILTSYIIWVLKNAEKMNIKTLYFLARDGQVMYKIAKELCDAYNIKIVCKYLYCSRYSLRKPLYYADKNEAIKRLCTYSMEISPERIMNKLELTKEEKDLIFSDIDISVEDHNKILTIRGLEIIKDKLESSQVFEKIALKKSQFEYKNLIQYFQQEGLFENVDYAFVDSGWIGSTQRSIRIIMEKEKNKKIHLKGFYFGLYSNPEAEDGDYYSFYFGPRNYLKRGVMFNNSLFECFCLADHGMTMGYLYENNKWNPILNEYKKDEVFLKQTGILFCFLKELIFYNKYNQLCSQGLAKKLEPIVKSIMCKPSRLEAEIYGNILFSDDTREEYFLPLAAALTKGELIKELVPLKIYYKHFSKKTFGKFVQSYWIEGTIARLNTPLKIVFTLNNWIIHFIKTINLRKW